MSVRTMARVWELSQLTKASELLMLLGIADFSDDDGNAYPAVSTLATKCRMTVRYANIILAALRESGELEIRQNEGPKGTNRYRITLGAGLNQSSPLNPASPLNPDSSTPEPGFPKPLNPASDEPSLNHQEPPVVVARPGGRAKLAKKTFKDWYANCERHDGKVLRANDPLYEYGKKLGLSYDFLALHWSWFSAKQTESPNKQADWIQTFRNSVKGNYGRLWYRSTEGTWLLTTTGKQAAIEHGFDEGMCSSTNRLGEHGAYV